MLAATTLFLALTLAAAEPATAIGSDIGTGKRGFGGDGGPASMALLDNPFDVTFDRAGNLYVSDTNNHRVRRVDARTGIITTVAGSGTKGLGGDGGPAVEAKLDEPYGVEIDPAGNLVFVDRLNRRVRRVDARSGLVTTIAGNGSKTGSGDGGPAAEAGLAEPNGIAFDAAGHLYIADVADHRVRKVDAATGIISTFAGTGKGVHSGDGGPAKGAGIFGARAVAVAPDGGVFIVERQGNTLRLVEPGTGTIRTMAGTGKKGKTGDGGPTDRATFDGPKELCLDAAGHVLIVDTENHAIRRYDGMARSISTVAGVLGQKGSDAAHLDRPHGVAVGPDGAIWIGDTGNHRIRRIVAGASENR